MLEGNLGDRERQRVTKNYDKKMRYGRLPMFFQLLSVSWLSTNTGTADYPRHKV